MDIIGKDSKRPCRIITGTCSQVEDQLAMLVPTYVAWQWRWDVVDGHHLLSVVMLLASDLERAMRMNQIAAATGMPGRMQ